MISCQNNDVDSFDNKEITENIFSNPEIREIINYQNERNSKSLLDFLYHSDPQCRETASLAMASVQNASILDQLCDVLENDESIKVRMAAAFAIGQIGNQASEKKLIELFSKEKSENVKSKILESIGKCGSDTGLAFLIKITINQENIKILNGALLGLARYSLRNLFSDNAVREIVNILQDKKYNDETKYFASISVSRIRDIDLSPYFKEFSDCYIQSSNLFLKMNMISAISKVKSDISLDFLGTVIHSSVDYRIKVNALKGLMNYDPNQTRKLILNSLNDTNVNIAIQASELILNTGVGKEAANSFFKLAGNIKNWRVKANLLAAALKYSTNKSAISSSIISAYRASNNIYEKAGLLKALSGDIANMKFVKDEIEKKKEFVIKSSGLESLVMMIRDSSFNLVNDKRKKSGKPDLAKEFAEVFKDAILTGDLAQVAIAAEVIRDPKLDFGKLYFNSYFLTQALNKCKLPQEIETYRELQKTIAYINGTKEPASFISKPKNPDWKFITEINSNQKIEINTTKGKIVLELYVNKAPVSVSNFLKLITEKYYENRTIHRTVPNFVVQDGCPRGDGWGGPDYAICSEFTMDYFTEGNLGMASAGKDTESSQWFITNSPTPHLDGRYSNFGKVIKGMDIVHLLEVGDTIISMTIANN